jgi:N-methylhydantoinase A
VTVTVNIDTGGTFTDGYFTRDELAVRVKVETTPHDFTDCLARCVSDGAAGLGFRSVQAMLLQCAAVRFSSTIGTNALLTRTGPRIGLIVSAGAGDSLYSKGESSLFGFLVRKDLVVEVADPFDEDEVRDRVQALLVAGARILVVSLADSDQDPGPELAIKRVLDTQYPRHYLGAVPCLLASAVTPRPDAELRTATAVLDAYLHAAMVKTLYQADEDLRSQGYARPLLVVHASGGVARVAKTKALETYNSGPVAGLYGAREMARRYGLDSVVSVDIGGTSTDVATILDGRLPFQSSPKVEGIPVLLAMTEVHTIGGGGGSIARRGPDGYRVGPDSAGAAPGPACYGLGGTRPTPTDAEVVLGTIDPGCFLGGRRQLDPERARQAIAQLSGEGEEEVAAGAEAIRRALVAVSAAQVQELIDATGRPAASFTMLAFGGGGGLYAADIAELAGIGRVLLFLHSAVFSAYGVASMEPSHIYEIAADRDLRAQLNDLADRARLDFAGEGFDPGELRFFLDVHRADHRLDTTELAGPAALGELPARSVAARLRVTAPIVTAEPARIAARAPGAAPARKGTRAVRYRGQETGAAVYDRALLLAGDQIPGPAVVESADTTVAVPPGARLAIDTYGTGLLEVW